MTIYGPLKRFYHLCLELVLFCHLLHVILHFINNCLSFLLRSNFLFITIYKALTLGLLGLDLLIQIFDVIEQFIYLSSTFIFDCLFFDFKSANLLLYHCKFLLLVVIVLL